MAATFARKVKRKFTLSDGTVLPKNSYIFVASCVFNRDPQNWESPDEFQADRFLKLRKKDESSNSDQQYRFEASRPDAPTFGTGIHACPARMLAGYIVK